MSCIWDRDTLAKEGSKQLETAKVIVGWFDRYPDLYYEMRLTRVLTEIENSPDDPELYDDAGVCHDRLHQSDQAIAMMEQKEHLLTRLAQTTAKELLDTHRYRYLANLGTFHVHRWIGARKSGKAADPEDLETAERLIAAAIELNPEAHFGREKYQLEAIRWLQQDEFGIFFMPAAEGVQNIEPDDNDRASHDWRLEEIRGWSGLIELGAAWESIDIFRALAYSLYLNRSPGLKILVLLRIEELKSEGVTSIHPNPDGDFREINLDPSLNHPQRKQIERWFKKARMKSDERHRKRTEYLLTRLNKGQHPDNHSEFWNDWKEPDFPEMTSRPFWTFWRIFGLIALSLIALKIGFDFRKRKKAKMVPT